MTVTKAYHFHSAHRNIGGGEKCARLHGHTYHVECDFFFAEQNEHGVTMLFADIDKVAEPIVKQYDHYTVLYSQDPLCEIFDNIGMEYKTLNTPTSAECFAVALFDEMALHLPISAIRLRETTSSTVCYKGA